MKISIVIFTRNRKEILEFALNKYKEQTYQNFEIILLDNASDDGTDLMIKSKFPEITYIYFPDNIFLYAFNYGVSLATGDLIWRTDDDAYPQTNDLFEKLVFQFENNSKIDIIGCEIFETKIQSLSYWYNHIYDKSTNYDENYSFKTNTFLGGGTMIKKNVFEKIGGFWDFGFEEIEFSTRAILNGFNIFCFPNLVVVHVADNNTRNLKDRKLMYYVQLTRYYTKYAPINIAIYNTLFILLVFTLYSVVLRFNFFNYIEGITGIINQFFKTFRKERVALSKQKYKEITFGKSYISSELVYFKKLFKTKIFKIKN